MGTALGGFRDREQEETECEPGGTHRLFVSEKGATARKAVRLYSKFRNRVIIPVLIISTNIAPIIGTMMKGCTA